MVRRNCHREGTFSFVSKTLTTTSLALSRKGYSVLFSLLMVYDCPMLLRLLILYSYCLIITVYTTTYSPGACCCNYTRPYGHTFISPFCGSNTHECNEAVLVYHDHSAMHTRNCSYDTHARWLKLLARLPWSCDLHSEPSSIISGFMDKSAAAQAFLMTITVVLVSYGIYIDQGRVMHKSTLEYD